MADQKDDFEAAFTQFSAPEEKAAPADTKPAAEAAASTDGGTTDAGGSGSGNAAGAGGEPGAAADAGSGDGGAAAAAGAEGAGDGAAAAAGGDAGASGAEASGEGAGDGKGGAAPSGEAPAAAAAPAGDAAPNADDVLAKLSKLVADAKPAEAPAAETKEQPKPPYSDEEAAQIAQYDKDWPDVAKGEALKRRGEYQELLGFVFAEVQKYVQPLMETIDALAGRAHLADVKAAVPDYSDNLRQQVVDWVAKQPAYLQTAYNHVIQNGTHDEVKDLVERYRQATGQAAPAAGAASTGGQGGKPAKDNELSGAAKEAAAALAPVESKRSEVINSGDPASFEDAWSQFAKDIA